MNRYLNGMFIVAGFVCCLSGCASMNAEEIGKGLQVGGMASGHGGVGLIGAGMEAFSKPDTSPGSPRYEKTKSVLYKLAAGGHLKDKYCAGIEGKTALSPDEIDTFAENSCKEVDQMVSRKEVIYLSRKAMLENHISEMFLPSDGKEEVPYELKSNPFGWHCATAMKKAAQDTVAKLRTRSGI